MVKIGMTIAALAVGATTLTGCDTTTAVAVTSAICTDASALQSSGLALNKNEATAVQGIITTCASTAGGTLFSNSTVALGLINDAILLQSSGLLKDIHITALAPAQKVAVKKIELDYAKARALGLVK